ncbi:bifunctional riboflavin kinase/FAD synthetase [Corynebacterium sp. ES2794-CONJ1]|uniref:bifunctional riboflavin kinase/FAD synthetase n=1 Tax=unclassified Corynebacterium TaxID=2624378 RepID=UPI002169CE72|nr:MULTISPECIES: bifunctional riboflavin kinase/FAD synthetase [unclassified Corynebacterium]MCS4489130.1 bifunctional riboflavin kinase/FAD synthetase [Corynebacterium sp. ES2775-CONJ]MCS4490943.1 bifunctional riboflavin kinase/FAD synthetase [Corynebacterium sp. ES2715-CONJ3]MCS4531175.1 bifunctional riboflavin kinase/FAD synthetase [Corynebacterium sp. ES2730-CONJ]MCU9518543.1 bifunctional riboflavin kinase/FAD synthetase [Corynebacterium sp. ES2794-CONJ1]
MNIWRGLDNIPADLTSSVVSIGVFDGMHRGHKTLLDAAVKRADELEVPSILLTFDPHPLAILRPDRMPPLLASVERRAELAAQEGIDFILAMTFSVDKAQLSPEDFFTEVLVNSLHARAVVVGENFTFGHNAEGTTKILQDLGKKYGVEIYIKDLLGDDGETICSTSIRRYLSCGEIRLANHALGREFEVCGEVVRGAGRGGRELGYPTANLYFPDSVALPKDAVYAGWLRVISEAPIDGDMEHNTRYPAAISVGHNPTFGDKRRSVESFVIGRDADLYGHTVVVEFVDFVRDMETFSGIDELVATIDKDVAHTLDILNHSS